MSEKDIYVCDICGLEVRVVRKGGMDGVNSDADGIIALATNANPLCCGKEMSQKKENHFLRK